MPDYRFYTIKQNGHVNGQPTSHQLADDAVAMAEAKKLFKGHDIEVWRDNHKVACLTAEEQLRTTRMDRAQAQS
jgi:hypothetical protein